MSNRIGADHVPGLPAIDLGYRRVGVLTRMPDVLLSLGADPAAVFRAAGLSPHDVARQEGSISYVAMGRLFRAAVEATGCEHIGLLLGREASLQTLGLMGQYMAQAKSVGDAMRALVQNYERFGRGSFVYMLTHGDHVLWGYAIHQKDMQGVEHVSEFALAAGARFLAGLCQEAPEEVLLPRSRPSNAAVYEDVFKAPVRFDSEQAALVIPARVADLPVRGADPARRAQMEANLQAYFAAQGGSISDRVLQTIRRALLAEARPSAASAAQTLGLHQKTLSRRLQEEGASFRRLLNDARFQLARQLLECTRMSVTDIALATGYADLVGFTHAFQRWTGSSASEWRAGASRAPGVSKSIRRAEAANLKMNACAPAGREDDS